MFTAIGALVDRFKGFFNRNFFLAALLPALIFIFLNTLLALLVFPETRSVLAQARSWGPGTQFMYAIGVLLFTVVFALIFSSLQPLFRQGLEGDLLPGGIRQLLKSRQWKQRQALEARFGVWRKAAFRYRKARKKQPTWLEQLQNARGKGKTAEPTIDVANPAYVVPVSLRQSLDDAEQLRNSWDQIPYPTMEQIWKDLVSELAAHNADLHPTLNTLHQRFEKLLEYAAEVTDNLYDDTWTELSMLFPQSIGRIGPTRLANVAEIHREYGLHRYGMDIDVFWIRLLKTVRADHDYMPILEEAKAQLDFAVGTTVTFTTLTVVWALPSLWAPTVTPFLVVWILGPLLAFSFYHVAVYTYRTFAETVRGAIDLHRFELLRALHLPLPADSEEEKKIWTSVLRPVHPLGGNIRIRFQHSDAPTTASSKPATGVLPRIMDWFLGPPPSKADDAT